MDSKQNPEEAKDAIRDASALLLAYIRKDIPTIMEINKTTGIANLLSGLLFVSGNIIFNILGQDAEGYLEDTLIRLSTVEDEFWEKTVAGSVVIEGNF